MISIKFYFFLQKIFKVFVWKNLFSLKKRKFELFYIKNTFYSKKLSIRMFFYPDPIKFPTENPSTKAKKLFTLFFSLLYFSRRVGENWKFSVRISDDSLSWTWSADRRENNNRLIYCFEIFACPSTAMPYCFPFNARIFHLATLPQFQFTFPQLKRLCQKEVIKIAKYSKSLRDRRWRESNNEMCNNNQIKRILKENFSLVSFGTFNDPNVLVCGSLPKYKVLLGHETQHRFLLWLLKWLIKLLIAVSSL